MKIHTVMTFDEGVIEEFDKLSKERMIPRSVYVNRVMQNEIKKTETGVD